MYLFVELCPPDVVEEHLAAITRVIPGQWRDADLEAAKLKEEIIIEGEFREE
jgi:hypothetical protein